MIRQNVSEEIDCGVNGTAWRQQQLVSALKLSDLVD